MNNCFNDLRGGLLPRANHEVGAVLPDELRDVRAPISESHERLVGDEELVPPNLRRRPNFLANSQRRSPRVVAQVVTDGAAEVESGSYMRMREQMQSTQFARSLRVLTL